MIVAIAVSLLLVMVVLLSMCAFNGGFNMGCAATLKKAEKLDRFISLQDNPLLSEQWNNYLTNVNVQNNKPDFWAWISFHGDK